VLVAVRIKPHEDAADTLEWDRESVASDEKHYTFGTVLKRVLKLI